jgi:YD repeat-containing protein
MDGGPTWAFVYDAASRLVTLVNPLGLKTTPGMIRQ